MRRDTFDALMRVLHFADNQLINGDRMYKVRPIFKIMNANFKQLKTPRKVSIDESMSKYYGNHSCKQAILNKPIRMGYKMWVEAAADEVPGYIPLSHKESKRALT